MTGYADLQQEALEALSRRNTRRRRILSGIRGRLRTQCRPRLLAFGIFLASLVPGFAAAWLAVGFGLDPWGPAALVAVLVQWPCYIGLARFVCRRLGARSDFLSGYERWIPYDEAAEAAENRRIFSNFPDETSESTWRGVREGLRGGFQQSNGNAAAALPVLLILGCMTLGTFVVWEIVRSSPGMFSEVLFDGVIVPERPGIEDRVTTRRWMSDAFAGTACYFVGLALVMLVLGNLLICSRGFVGQ